MEEVKIFLNYFSILLLPLLPVTIHFKLKTYEFYWKIYNGDAVEGKAITSFILGCYILMGIF